METYRIALLPGDGIGPEVTNSAVEVLEAVSGEKEGLLLDMQSHPAGAGEFMKNGNDLPESTLEACADADAVLLGAMGLPSVRWPDGRELTPQIDIRERLDLYGGLRPIKLYHRDDTPLKNHEAGGIDIMLVRENTEGLFAARKNGISDDSKATDQLVLTRKGCERIVHLAMQEAMKRRKKVTLVDKANVLPSMVFFRKIFEEVASGYPEVETESVYIDAMALYLVQRPETFDVVVTENMFGDILSDLLAGIVGGMGFAPSGDIGDTCAVFQPSHGTAPDIAGKGIANPVATILSAAMMLNWLPGEAASSAGIRIEQAVASALANPENRGADRGGSLGTKELTTRIIECL
ncbi:MAG: isocitrate/isopropylmalate dehydrogenase family protein [Puniceicoccaceae bacterium]